MIRAAVWALLLLAPQQAKEELRPGLLGEFFELQGDVEDFPAVKAEQKPALRRRALYQLRT